MKGDRAKGKSQGARDINLALDNVKAQIIKHYQKLSDREAFVTAEMVRNAYQGIGSEYETRSQGLRLLPQTCGQRKNYRHIQGDDVCEELCGGFHQVVLQTHGYVNA